MKFPAQKGLINLSSYIYAITKWIIGPIKNIFVLSAEMTFSAMQTPFFLGLTSYGGGRNHHLQMCFWRKGNLKKIRLSSPHPLIFGEKLANRNWHTPITRIKLEFMQHLILGFAFFTFFLAVNAWKMCCCTFNLFFLESRL